MLCGWKSNRRSGVALAMHHRLSGMASYRLSHIEKGDEKSKALVLDIAPLNEMQ